MTRTDVPVAIFDSFYSRSVNAFVPFSEKRARGWQHNRSWTRDWSRAFVKIIRHSTAESAEKVFLAACRWSHCRASLRCTVDRVRNTVGFPFVLLAALVAKERANDYDVGHKSRGQDL